MLKSNHIKRGAYMDNYIRTLYDKLENITPLNSSIHMAKKPFPSIERFVILIFPELDSSDDAMLRKCIKETRQQSDVIKEDFVQWQGMSFYNKLLEYYNPDYTKTSPQDFNYALQKEAEKKANLRLSELIEDSVRRVSGKKNVTQISKSDMEICLEKISDCLHEAVHETCRDTRDLFFFHYTNAFHKTRQYTIETVTYQLYSYLRYAFTKQYPADALQMGITTFAEDVQTFMLRFIETTTTSYDELYAVLYSMADPFRFSNDNVKQRPNSVVLGLLILLEYFKLDIPFVDVGEVIDNYFFYLRKLEQYNPQFPYTFFFRGLIQYRYLQKKKENPLVKVAELEQLLSYGLDNYFSDTLKKLSTAGDFGNGTATWLIATILNDPDVPSSAKEAYLGLSASKKNKDEIQKAYIKNLYKVGEGHLNQHSTAKIAEIMAEANAPLEEVIPKLESAIDLGATEAVITLGKIYAGMTQYDIHDQIKAEALFSRAYTMLQREHKLEAAFLILELYRKNPNTTIPIANMTIHNEYILMNSLAGTLARNYAEAYEVSEKKRIDADIRLCNQLLDKIREKM